MKHTQSTFTLPILQVLLESPNKSLKYQDIVSGVLAKLGIGLGCMGSDGEGRPLIYTPFSNAGSELRSRGLMTAEGRTWIITEAGEIAAQTGVLPPRAGKDATPKAPKTDEAPEVPREPDAFDAMEKPELLILAPRYDVDTKYLSASQMRDRIRKAIASGVLEHDPLPEVLPPPAILTDEAIRSLPKPKLVELAKRYGIETMYVREAPLQHAVIAAQNEALAKLNPPVESQVTHTVTVTPSSDQPTESPNPEELVDSEPKMDSEEEAIPDDGESEEHFSPILKSANMNGDRFPVGGSAGNLTTESHDQSVALRSTLRKKISSEYSIPDDAPEWAKDPYLRALVAANTPCYGTFSPGNDICKVCPLRSHCGGALATTLSTLSRALEAEALKTSALTEEQLSSTVKITADALDPQQERPGTESNQVPNTNGTKKLTASYDGVCAQTGLVLKAGEVCYYIPGEGLICEAAYLARYGTPAPIVASPSDEIDLSEFGI